ncbi:glycosyltransferase family 4 protein [Pedobacter nyackensis]|uniref:Glycosyltransferase involved in cell wall bisynthesis n=1 Tax=Pedobacter nyackensis TaxID=475255 RepID=A0A1W2C1T8_9SPHI|nr:glycosyltransferase family 4 protein [Pedobacter nyackensis]SMC79205.1 Glycosyltransferase involved in cell wall bisynthesis [Pedobacter nyackensis]
MKNILFFFSSTLVGGAETNILKISRELSLDGYHIYWCYLMDDGPLLDLVDFELKDHLETGLFYKSPMAFFSKYKAFIEKNEIDVVLNFGLRTEIISRLVSKKFGVKKMVSNIRSTDDWRKWYHTTLDRLTKSSVDLWVSNSIAGKRIFHKRERISEDKIKVIYNFYESPESHEVQINLIKPGILKIGILANITREKGYFDLIDLSKELESMGIAHQFTYAGIDKLNGAFEAELEKNGLSDKFEYMGYIKKKKTFFDQIDLFLLPSYLEGMPTVILEAMAFKKPVISTTVGGIPELIDNGKNGYLCPPGNIKCFAQSIESVYHGKSVSFQEECEQRLKEFSKESIMTKWKEAITNYL